MRYEMSASHRDHCTYAGARDCGCQPLGRSDIPDMLAVLQDHAHSILCSLVAGPVLDPSAVGVPACLGSGRGVCHHEWQHTRRSAFITLSNTDQAMSIPS